jgi:hypothetical protein
MLMMSTGTYYTHYTTVYILYMYFTYIYVAYIAVSVSSRTAHLRVHAHQFTLASASSSLADVVDI